MTRRRRAGTPPNKTPAVGKQARIIDERLNELNIPRSIFGERVGISGTWCRRVFQGRAKLTSREHVEAAAELLGISADTLYDAAEVVPPDVLDALQKHRTILVPAVRRMVQKIEGRS